MESSIRKFALENAIKYNGKANQGAVIGHLLAEDHSLKSKLKEISPKIARIIKEVNALGVEKATAELMKIAPELLEEKKKGPQEKVLTELKNVGDKVIMRFEPSPSGALHIGHAYVLSLNSEYCKKYNGKLILRIADTNPENIYEPAYGIIEEDAKWITGDRVNEVLLQSQRLPIYYSYMEKLLDMDKVYICTCDPEHYKELNTQSKACPCRDLPKKEQQQRWKKMFKGYEQGEAVARVKTDLNHKNPAMRDFPIFRINDSKHPRQGTKSRVWPLMNMAVTVDDIENKVTHVIRAKDHYDNAMRQRYLFDYLGKKFPEALFVGRINFEGMPVSATKTRKAIEAGTYSGWDDIRIPFLQALKRRGYQAGAFVRYAIDVGVSLTDKTVSRDEYFKVIDAFNKDCIDPQANRYFFISKPKKITLEGAPAQKIELDLHPQTRKGGRTFDIQSTFYIEEQDYDNIKEGKLYRLMDCLNFTKKGKKLLFHSLDYQTYKEKGEGIMHWLPEETIPIHVLMPDNTLMKGMGEKGLSVLKVDTIVQLERFGFCRLDAKGSFWFCQR